MRLRRLSVSGDGESGVGRPGFSANINNPVAYPIWLCGIAAIYFALALGSLGLASLHPSAAAIWPPTGFALAAVLLLGYRVWPAILAGAFLANDFAHGTLYSSATIAAGNTAEALISGYLVNRWCGGRRAFELPASIIRFALIVAAVAAAVSASIGILGLSLSDDFDSWGGATAVWSTWWLGNVGGAVVLTPVIVLWANQPLRRPESAGLLEMVALFAVTVGVCLLIFSPLLRPVAIAAPLAFAAIFPLTWAALHRGPRDTATVILLIAGFGAWGAYADVAPLFNQPTVNGSLLVLAAFSICLAVPSLTLSAEVARRRRVEARLRAREHEFRQIFSQALLGISQRDAEGRFLFVNEAFCRLTGRSEAELLRLRVDELIEPADLEANRERLRQALATGEGYNLELRLVRPDGERVWTHAFVSPLYDEAGQLRHVVAVTEDVSERHRAEERRRLLMAELDHRVRNNLATVQSMLRLTGQYAPSKEAYAEAIERRVAALARAHNLLRREDWKGARVDDLVRLEIGAYLGDGGPLTIQGPACTLEPRRALDLAMLLHELATNAARHGALSAAAGRLSVDWQVRQWHGEEALDFSWRESGGPPVAPPARTGFGGELIRNILKPHNATVELDFPPTGVYCRIVMPLGASAETALSRRA